MSVDIMLSVMCLSVWIILSSSMTWKLSNVSVHALQRTDCAFIGYHNNTVQILGGRYSENDIIEFPLDGTWNTSTTTSITFGYQWGQSSIQIDAQLWMLPYNKQYLNVFDLNTKSIIKNVLFPGTAIAGRCVTSYNEYVFIIGGAGGVSGFHIYNRLSTNWSTGTSLNNFGRQYHSCNVIDNTLYIIGGMYDNTVEYTNISPLTNSIWTQITDTLSSAKHFHRSIIFENLIYVIGGDDAEGIYIDQVDVIDTISKTISAPPTNKLVYARNAVSTIVANGYIYVIGGVPLTDHIHYQYASIPTQNPTSNPTSNSTQHPSEQPTKEPTKEPTDNPSQQPIEEPSPLQPTYNSKTINPTQAQISKGNDNEIIFKFTEVTFAQIIIITCIIIACCCPLLIGLGVCFTYCYQNKPRQASVVNRNISNSNNVNNEGLKPPGLSSQDSLKIKPGLQKNSTNTIELSEIINLKLPSQYTLNIENEGLDKNQLTALDSTDKKILNNALDEVLDDEKKIDLNSINSGLSDGMYDQMAQTDNNKIENEGKMSLETHDIMFSDDMYNQFDHETKNQDVIHIIDKTKKLNDNTITTKDIGAV